MPRYRVRICSERAWKWILVSRRRPFVDRRGDEDDRSPLGRLSAGVSVVRSEIRLIWSIQKGRLLTSKSPSV